MATIKDYFDFCAQDTWKCSVCEKEVKAKTTSNLLQHFRHHHPNTYEEYVEVAKRRPSATHARAVVSSKKPRKIHIIKHDDPTADNITSEAAGSEFEWSEAEMDQDKLTFTELSSTTALQQPVSSSHNNPRQDDPLKLFFNSMYGTVSRMSPEDIFSIRRRIFDVVCEYEEAQLLLSRKAEVVTVVQE